MLLYFYYQKRYKARAKVVRKCQEIQQEQLLSFKNSVIKKRQDFIDIYKMLHNDLNLIVTEEKQLFERRTKYVSTIIDRTRFFHNRLINVVKVTLTCYREHCSAIKNRMYTRMQTASMKFQNDLKVKFLIIFQRSFELLTVTCLFFF